MEQQFEAVLTGSDTPVEGIVNRVDYTGYNNAYEFNAIDGTIHLVIAQEADNRWHRLAGSEPYFAGWVDELVEQVNKENGTTAL